MLRTLYQRLRAHFTGNSDERRLKEEIAGHIEELAADYERRGLTPREAHLAARREFGGITQMQEEHRERRRLPFADSLAQDLRYTFRQMRAHPAFAAAAILTLALGIGANTAMYQLLETLIYRPLPVRDPGQLMQVLITTGAKPMKGSFNPSFSYPRYSELAARQTVAQGIYGSGIFATVKAELRTGGSVEQVNGVLVSGSYFPVLGVSAQAGRALADGDDRAGAPAAAVISDALWERRFARRSDALGQSIEVNHRIATIVGVAPRSFFGDIFGITPDVWLPLSAQVKTELDDRNSTWIAVMLRLKPGMSQAHTQTALNALYHQLPDAPKDARIELEPGYRGIPLIQGQYEPQLLLLAAVVALALIIACCNLANLLLSRASSRTHEIGVRLAMGAARSRLIRQLFTESLTLALLGGAVALLFCNWAVAALAPLTIDPAWSLSLPGSTLFVCAVAVACTCLFGIVPAFAATRVDVHSALQTSTRSQSSARSSHFAGRLLVVAQLSVSLLLVSGAGLVLRSLWNLTRQDPGFRTNHVVVADIPWDFTRQVKPRDISIAQPLLERLRALPGVESAAVSTFAPLSQGAWNSPVATPGRTAKQVGEDARMAPVSDHYFDTLGIRILAGRGIDARDRSSNKRTVAVLGATAARRLFGAANPIGQMITAGSLFNPEDALEVVGVSADVRYSDLREPFGLLIYVPLAQTDDLPIASAVLRAAGDPAALGTAIRATMHELDSTRTVGEIRRLTDIVDERLSQDRSLAALLTVFGSLALALTCIGVYGVVSFGASRRTQEIGIRIALGAQRGGISRMLMRETGGLLAISAVVGIVGAFIGARLMGSMLFGISAWDISMPVEAAILLSIVAGLAAWIPARRASRLDPMVALRQE